MSATSLAAKPAQTCPTWCQHEADENSANLHMSEVHEVRDVLLHLSQQFNDRMPTIGLTDSYDQELYFTVDEAERVGTILLQLVRAARKATAPRAA
jgi:hypothetical protein